MKIVSMFLALALTAFAAESTPRLSRLYVAEVPADSAAEFYAVQRETADIYKANKAPMPRLCWTTITGVAKFVNVMPLEGLDKLGERTWLSQQGEEMSRQARTSRLRKATGDSTTKVIADVEEAGWNPAPGAAPSPYISVSIYSIKPGKAADFIALMKEATAIVKKLGKAKGVYVGRVNYGGDTGEYHVVTGYASLADIASQGDFRAAMGETAYAAYIKKIGEVVNSRHRDIYRFRPEFSYIPAK